MTDLSPGPCPDLSTYGEGLRGPAYAAAYEWLLSDHPWAVAERARRRAAHHARRRENATEARQWADRTRSDRPDRSDEVGASMTRLVETMRPIAARVQLRAAVDEVEPDDLAVVEYRRQLQNSRQAAGEDYVYPTHLIGPGAAVYPPPGWTPDADAGGEGRVG